MEIPLDAIAGWALSSRYRDHDKDGMGGGELENGIV